jgi:hypothetical protein
VSTNKEIKPCFAISKLQYYFFTPLKIINADLFF